jgi:type II secretory pathway pseudopilin PulG
MKPRDAGRNRGVRILRTAKFSSAAFSLPELLVVISVMSALGGAIITVFNPTVHKNRTTDSVKLTNIREVSEALNTYKVLQGKFPTSSLDNKPSGIEQFISNWPQEGLKYVTETGTRMYAVYVPSSEDPNVYFKYNSCWSKILKCDPAGVESIDVCANPRDLNNNTITITSDCTLAALPPLPTTPTPVETPTPTPTDTPTPTPTVTPTPTPTPTGIAIDEEVLGPSTCEFFTVSPSGNLIQNHSFEAGLASIWKYNNNGTGSFSLVDTDHGNNVQLYQTGFPLVAGVQYRLNFYAKSSLGGDLNVSILRHSYPYTLYSSSNDADFTTNWQPFTYTFTVSGFTGTTTDTRLRFYINNEIHDDEQFFFDAITLVRLDTMQQVLSNTSFESNASGWSYYENGARTIDLVTPGATSSTGNQAARITVDPFTLIRETCGRTLYYRAGDPVGTSIGFYQNGISLDPHSRYRLVFAARSDSERDIQVNLVNDASQSTYYGLTTTTVDLIKYWKLFTIEFTTENFETPVTNGRLRFWLHNSLIPVNGVYVDRISLQKI